jgi:hypothetical protein
MIKINNEWGLFENTVFETQAKALEALKSDSTIQTSAEIDGITVEQLVAEAIAEGVVSFQQVLLG